MSDQNPPGPSSADQGPDQGPDQGAGQGAGQNPPEQPSFNQPGSGQPGSGQSGSGQPSGTQPVPPAPPAPSAAQQPASGTGDSGGSPQGATRASAVFDSSATVVTEASAGFFSALFDFSFTTFVTPKIVRFVYVLAAIYAVFSYVLFTIAGFSQSLPTGMLVLLLGPFFAIIWLAAVRIGLEFGVAVVRMSEDINKRLPHA